MAKFASILQVFWFWQFTRECYAEPDIWPVTCYALLVRDRRDYAMVKSGSEKAPLVRGFQEFGCPCLSYLGGCSNRDEMQFGNRGQSITRPASQKNAGVTFYDLKS